MATITISGNPVATQTLSGGSNSINLGFSYTMTGSNGLSSLVTLTKGSWSRLDSGSCADVALIVGNNGSTSSISIATDAAGVNTIATIPSGLPFLIPQMKSGSNGQGYWGTAWSGSTADVLIGFSEM